MTTRRVHLTRPEARQVEDLLLSMKQDIIRRRMTKLEFAKLATKELGFHVKESHVRNAYLAIGWKEWPNPGRNRHSTRGCSGLSKTNVHYRLAVICQQLDHLIQEAGATRLDSFKMVFDRLRDSYLGGRSPSP